MPMVMGVRRQETHAAINTTMSHHTTCAKLAMKDKGGASGSIDLTTPPASVKEPG